MTLTNDELDRIAALTGGDREWADRVAKTILARATGPVTSPFAFIHQSILRHPQAYRAPQAKPRPVSAHGYRADAHDLYCVRCSLPKRHPSHTADRTEPQDHDHGRLPYRD